jgi:hypothetical protein
LEVLTFSQTTPQPSQLMVFTFHLRVPPGLQFNQVLPTKPWFEVEGAGEGAGSEMRPCGRKGVGGWGLTQGGVARLAGSGPTAVGADGQHVRVRPAPNMGSQVTARWASEIVQGGSG